MTTQQALMVEFYGGSLDGTRVQLDVQTNDWHVPLRNQGSVLYVPDPNYETHCVDVELYVRDSRRPWRMDFIGYCRE
jgi:hypothetical protein